MKKKWFLYFLKKSLSQRKGRIAIASLAVMLSVAVVTGMIGITLGIKEKLGYELRSYGANMMVLPEQKESLDFDILQTISNLEDIHSVEGQVFDTASVNGEVLEIIGLDIGLLKNRSWKISGTLPAGKREILAGVTLRDALNVETGEVVSLEKDGKRTDFTISGFFEKGGTEDRAFIMSLEDSWNLAGTGKVLSAVLLRGSAGKLETLTGIIKERLPGVTVKTVRQVAIAEESLLDKVLILMAMVSAVVLFASSISVGSTIGANVIERREEIGLMKAIGATRNNVRAFYMAESLLIGIIGGTAGFAAGYVIAQAVSKGAFESFIEIPLYTGLLSLIMGVLISLLSGYFPVQDALKLNPAVILREE